MPSLAVATEGLGILLRLLAPVVPHITHALWVECGYARVGGELIQAAWPQVEEDALLRSQITLVLQINGKVRGSISVPADADGPTIEANALASEAFQRAASGQAPKKIIHVAGRLVNVVV
jgi:leucyl-tRNA synthetase